MAAAAPRAAPARSTRSEARSHSRRMPRAWRSAAHTRTSGAQVRSVECRTTLCSIVLEWPGYAAAHDAIKPAIEHAYSLNCERNIFVPPPDREAQLLQPYTWEMILNCSSTKRRDSIATEGSSSTTAGE